jgi:hypothetical protein
MWRNKNVQRAKPEHVFVEPEPPKGAKQLPFCCAPYHQRPVIFLHGTFM